MDNIEDFLAKKSEGDTGIQEPLSPEDEEITEEKAHEINNQLKKIGGIVADVRLILSYLILIRELLLF